MRIARIRLAGVALENLAYMFVKSMAAPWFWWLDRTGREVQADALAHRMTLSWTNRIFRRLGCRVEVEGEEHLQHEGALVVMANHQAIFDIPLLLGYSGRRMGFVFKRELLRIPGLRYWMRRNHCVALDRSDVRGTAALFRSLAESLNASGRALVLFPEGTRTRDPEGAFGPFKRGALRLPQAGQISIQPIVLEGTRYLVDPVQMARTPKGERTVRLRILPPRTPPTAGGPAAKAFMDSLREEMSQHRDALGVTWN